MLLPSALTCDTKTHTTIKTRYQTSLFASPPLSPPATTTSTTITNIYSTCRALQSMLTTPTQLPSPPLAHAAPPSSSSSSSSHSSPLKLRLRQREEGGGGVRKKIAKKPALAPPRGLNKRRRGVESESEDSECDDHIILPPNQQQKHQQQQYTRASTPKRARVAPENIPLGLSRSDFHDVHLQNMTTMAASASASFGEVLESVEGRERNENGNRNGADREEGGWSTEEDRILVELVLEKLKLSKEEWQDCARSLGKDRGSVGKRWKSLMGAGEVGLKRNSNRRAKIHGTWR